MNWSDDTLESLPHLQTRKLNKRKPDRYQCLDKTNRLMKDDDCLLSVSLNVLTMGPALVTATESIGTRPWPGKVNMEPRHGPGLR